MNDDIQQGYRYAMIVQYEGTLFSGYQTQQNAPSVQDHIEKALSIILKHPVKTECAGRTDAGVHATGQVVSFQCNNIINENITVRSLNSIIPSMIKIQSMEKMPRNFHPRFSCLCREYEYLFWDGNQPSPFWNGRVLWVRHKMNVENLHEELQPLIGEHDFCSLTKSNSLERSTVRYIDRLTLTRIRFDPLTGQTFHTTSKVDNDNHNDFLQGSLVSLNIRGNAFLHNMIRILAGTILDRSRGKMKTKISDAVFSRSRSQTGVTAISDGLYFRNAYYPAGYPYRYLKSIENYPIFTERQSFL